MQNTVRTGNGPCFATARIRVASRQVRMAPHLLDAGPRAAEPWSMPDIPNMPSAGCSVGDFENGPPTGSRRLGPVERRWLGWARSLCALGVVAVLAALGVANMALRAGYHDVEDGVFWTSRAEGVTA